MDLKKYTHKNCTWYDIAGADEKAVAYLKRKFKFHELDLEDCLSATERPKIDRYKDYLFIVLFLPLYIKESKRTVARAVRIFVGPDYVVTLHGGQLKPFLKLREALKLKKNKDYYLGESAHLFLYELLSDMFQYCFPILDKIGRNINEIEENIFGEEAEHETRDMLKEIARNKRDIIVFRRIILPQRAVIIKLEKDEANFFHEGLRAYFGDVGDQIEKIWDMLSGYKELIESLEDTNESIISHRINSVMKILTIFSVTLLPLTFITGLYGMNVNLPLAYHSSVFWMIALGMLGLVVLMITFFKRRGWL